MVTTPTTPTLDDLLAGLPARIRVHDLARRAGRSSKETLAALAAQGTAVTSASSAVAADVAAAVLTGWFGPPPESAPDGATDQADAPVSLEDTIAAADVPAEETAAPDGQPSAADEIEAASGASRSRRSGRRRRRGGDRGATTEDAAAEAPDADAVTAAGPAAEIDEQAGTADAVAAATGASGTEAGAEESGAEESGATESGEADPDGAESSGRGRRRRRGRRGRSRSGVEADDATEGGEAEPTAPADAEAAEGDEDEDAEAGEAESEGTEAGTRRRRRRRRRSGGSEDAGHEDDPDNTVVHVRESRSAATEVQGVRGSTRLEAKRQRRRDTRESRRRPQILSEAEFLARRESVERVMAVRQRGDLAQIALLEDGGLVEHFVSQSGRQSLMGTIYLGRVQNVLPSMEAAFVDIGRGRNAVLYAGEVNWDAAGLAGKARRIETALSPGDTLLVQVTKDPVGQKGARLTTQISLPGRFLVYVPGGGATGISRKLPDVERKRLKSILDRIVPEDAGVIIRTAAEGAPEDELVRDVERLQSQWTEISQAAENTSSAPVQLSNEPDTLTKVVRDLFNSDITRLVIDGDDAYTAISGYVEAVAPELAGRVHRHDGPRDVFAAYRVDEQIAKALERKVHLPSGGSLVIDRTEAMTVVDVNTGKYTGSGGNLEETVTKNNLEAAEEIVRQLRLRDIGGIIVIDFIDMVLESNRDLVLRRLTECLGRDRTRHQVAEVTSLGLVQMTRKKMGTGLVEAFSEPCPHCGGRGIVLHDMPVEKGAPDEAEDAERRTGRSRRNRQRPEPAPAPAAVAVASVRPPDPRGPRPPRATDHGLDGDAEAASDLASGVSEAVENPDEQAVAAEATQAVSAVLAALDAAPVEPAAVDGAPAADPTGSLPPLAEAAPGRDQDATEPVSPVEAAGPVAASGSGRPRRRRAASRPAGPAVPVVALVEPGDAEAGS